MHGMGDTSALRSYFVRLSALARLELKGILRSHPFLLFLPVAALVVLVVPSLVFFTFSAKREMVAQLGISTATLFASLTGLLAGASSLARERADGTRELLLSRPLDPFTYVLGKWLGISAAVALSVAVLGGTHLIAVALRDGPPRGFGPLVAALGVAVVQGGLAAAVALAFSARLRPGPAFVAALLFLLAGHVATLVQAPEAIRFLLPRSPAMNLAAEAAFGPFGPSLWALAALHGIVYSLFLLALAAPLAGRGRKT